MSAGEMTHAWTEPEFLLHIEGNWDLVKAPGINNEYFSLIVHHCKSTGKNPVRYYKNTYHLPCKDCGEEVPESIQGLWAMHNMDKARNSPNNNPKGGCP